MVFDRHAVRARGYPVKALVLEQDERVGRWVCERLGSEWYPGKGIGMGLEEDGELIAGVLFDSFNGASICMHVAAVPGKRWMNRELLWYAFAYPFLQLKVTKILGPVSAAAVDVLEFDKHLGFVLEATLKDAHPDGDLLILSMTKDQCKWLNIKVPQNGQQSQSSEGS